MHNLISIEGFKVGYDLGALYTPLEYLQRSNPKKTVFPKGFRRMLVEHCPDACFQMKQGLKVYGFRTKDIIEENFNARNK